MQWLYITTQWILSTEIEFGRVRAELAEAIWNFIWRQCVHNISSSSDWRIHGGKCIMNINHLTCYVITKFTEYAKYDHICEITRYNSEKCCSILVSCESLCCFCTPETETVGITFLFQNPYFIMSFGWLNLNWVYSCKFQNNAWIHLKCLKGGGWAGV